MFYSFSQTDLETDGGLTEKERLRKPNWDWTFNTFEIVN